MHEAKRVRVGAIEVEYAEAGAPGDGARPFVLVHGFTGSRDDFADVLPALGRARHTITPDNRGHGGTTNPGRTEAYDFEQLVGDLAGFLDALGIERCDLLGHSLGGMTAMRFALAHPERLASLVLMDTSPGPLSLMPRAIMEGGAKVAREHGMATLYAGMRANPGPRPPASIANMERMGEEPFWARIEAKLLAMDPEAFAALGLLLAEHEPVEDRLAEIRCPTLVLVGEQDLPFRKPSERMAAAIPDATLAVIPDAAHSPQFENEPAWLTALASHFGDGPR